MDIDTTTGIWLSENPTHVADPDLANSLRDFLIEKNARSVADFGCGVGDYGKIIRKAGMGCLSLDGNPHTQTLSYGFAVIADLTKPLELGIDFDWGICLEVGEHIPAQHENILLENITRNSKVGIVLSWATVGQNGDGHINERPNNYIETLMLQKRFIRCSKDESLLRASAMLPYFKESIMVFQRESLHANHLYGG